VTLEKADKGSPGLVDTAMADFIKTRSGVANVTEIGGISVDTSVQGLLSVVQGLTKESSGSFLKYNGGTIPW
jgi:hypothetical protein